MSEPRLPGDDEDAPALDRPAAEEPGTDGNGSGEADHDAPYAPEPARRVTLAATDSMSVSQQSLVERHLAERDTTVESGTDTYRVAGSEIHVTQSTPRARHIRPVIITAETSITWERPPAAAPDTADRAPADSIATAQRQLESRPERETVLSYRDMSHRDVTGEVKPLAGRTAQRTAQSAPDRDLVPPPAQRVPPVPAQGSTADSDTDPGTDSDERRGRLTSLLPWR